MATGPTYTWPRDDGRSAALSGRRGGASGRDARTVHGRRPAPRPRPGPNDCLPLESSPDGEEHQGCLAYKRDGGGVDREPAKWTDRLIRATSLECRERSGEDQCLAVVI